ncbi:uncharacterized protein [Arachis hypogaea]|uniref:uncharacterized protein n=1 Tax=Arachis hypogaea TaxID=3818 RepID=UPI003B223826
MVEAERLQYHRHHQNKFCSRQLQGLHECLIHGETQAAKTGKRVILPSSFVGGSRYMYNNCKDAFAICRLNIISRVFKIKLGELLKDLKNGSIFGKPKPNEKPRSSDDIDHHISVEILDEHMQPKLYRLVHKFMVHGPCGVLNTSSPCMVNGKCSKFYPMAFCEKTAIDNTGFPKYKCSDNGRKMCKKNVDIDNRFIVPYNVTLLVKYGCHINVEYTFQTSAIKYLFKYVHKGNDRVTASFFRSRDSDDSYISSCEASWRLFGFEIQFKEPNVIRLPFHLPNEQNALYEDHQLIQNVIENAVSKDRCHTFADIRSIGGFVYNTFKEAYYALELLQDDREFIDAINEASLGFEHSADEIKSTTLAKIEKLLQPNALLLPNGRTAHSRFKVPLSVNQDSICNIRQGTPLTHLISSAKLIIWDEATMLNKFCFEALDKCLKDVLRFDHEYNPDAPFGGKVLQLTKNMRLGRGPQDIHNVQLEEFAVWLLQIGDGLFGDSTDGESVIRIPDNLLLDIESLGLHDLVLFVYPDILLRTSSVDYFKDRSILAPTLDVVTEVNNHVMSLISGNERVYLSSDTLLNEDGHLEFELYTMSTESLNAMNCTGIPQHMLVLKIGVPVMLLRNIDQSNGLCNGTRMQVRRLGDHVIECVILAGRNIGEVVFIHRMNMVPNNETLPIRFTWRQFSIALCFAMTINKS